MGFIPWMVNNVWLLKQRKDVLEYWGNQSKVTEFQEGILLGYLLKNADTSYGKKYNFSNIKTFRAYQDNVPIIEDYAQIQPFVDEIADGVSNVLTTEDPLFFETTSGSSGDQKWIPYTPTFKHEFNKSLAVWIHSLYKTFPGIKSGMSFWSISPPLKERSLSKGGIPVGMEDDSAYLNAFDRWLIEQINIKPNGLSKDRHTFYMQLCQALLSERNLRFISIWSPNYFLQLDQFIHQNWGILQQQVGQKRKELVKMSQFSWRQAFPKLQLLSCWQDASAQTWLPSIKAILPDVHLHRKGLLATEGCTTIPIGKNENALAYTSHFFEFRDVESKEVVWAEDLRPNVTYEVILTTGSGLYRYATKDLVVLKRYQHKIPILDFIGRRGRVSDLVGEKIDELVVLKHLRDFQRMHPGLCQICLFPLRKQHQVQYNLYYVGEHIACKDLKHWFESNLMKNPYYQQGMAANQLLPLHVEKVPSAFFSKLFAFYAKRNHIEDGDVKLPILFSDQLMFDFLTHYNA